MKQFLHPLVCDMTYSWSFVDATPRAMIKGNDPRVTGEFAATSKIPKFICAQNDCQEVTLPTPSTEVTINTYIYTEFHSFIFMVNGVWFKTFDNGSYANFYLKLTPEIYWQGLNRALDLFQ